MANDVVFQSATPATPAAAERVSAEEVTTLNGGAATAQKVQRVILAVRTGSATAVDLGKAEDAASASGDALIPIGVKRSDTPAATSGTDGDYEPLQSAGGRLWTSAVIDTALPAGTNNIGDVDVLSLPALPAGTNAIGKLAANSGVDIGDVDVTSVIPGTGATSLGKAEDAAHSTGDTGVMALGVRKDTAAQLAGTDGDYTPSIYDANGRLHVVNSAGVGGDVAHDAVESGNPISIGGIARTANPAPVSALDRVRGWFTVLGKFVVQIGAPRELITHQHTQIASSSSETTILNAGGAGVLLDLVTLIITNQTATAVNVTIKDDTAGTTRMIIALAANGGAVLSFPRPVNQAVANKPWTATLSSGSVTVNFFVQAEQNV